MKKNTQLILAGVAIILAICLVVQLSETGKHERNEGNEYTQHGAVPPTSKNNTTPTTPRTTSKTVSPKTTPVAPAMSYGDAVKKYDGIRFQFGNNCASVTPTSFVLKSGEQFMVDNRENIIHTFTFEKQRYVVMPFGYAIFTTRTGGAQSIYCDGVQRAKVDVAR